LTPLDSNDLLFDGVSKLSTYNIGNYKRNGYVVSADQRVNNSLDVAMAYGRLGGFGSDSNGQGLILKRATGTQQLLIQREGAGFGHTHHG